MNTTYIQDTLHIHIVANVNAKLGNKTIEPKFNRCLLSFEQMFPKKYSDILRFQKTSFENAVPSQICSANRTPLITYLVKI